MKLSKPSAELFLSSLKVLCLPEIHSMIARVARKLCMQHAGSQKLKREDGSLVFDIIGVYQLTLKVNGRFLHPWWLHLHATQSCVVRIHWMT